MLRNYIERLKALILPGIIKLVLSEILFVVKNWAQILSFMTSKKNIKTLIENFLLLLFLLFSPLNIGAQDTIRIVNGSFEGTPHRGNVFDSTKIEGWIDCGPYHKFHGQSPPDIHPGGFWGNHVPANDGKTYLGLITRQNGTFESVSQKLSKPMLPGKCYSITVQVARAEKIMNLSMITGDTINYDNPVILHIWGGNSLCKNDEILVETGEIKFYHWQTLHLTMKPKHVVEYIIFAAMFKKPLKELYGGNLLLDGVSDIISGSCTKKR